ncbi:MAG: hypothetical protein O3A33_12260 [Chloroflexi bacterium]|nr:hypothetical protein [Chloroflexota bacterium]
MPEHSNTPNEQLTIPLVSEVTRITVGHTVVVYSFAIRAARSSEAYGQRSQNFRDEAQE